MLHGLFIACADVQAIAVADLTTSEDPPSDEGYSFNWDYVYNYQYATSVAVDHYWILTAAHVADDGFPTTNLTINGELYTQQEIVFHSKASDPDSNETADIALVRYDKPFPGYYPLSSAVPVGSDIMICGYGRFGSVVSTFSDAYFTEDDLAHSTKRWGTNRIDGENSYSSTEPIVATTKGFDISISRDRGNAGKTDYEAGCNIYDSGGGMFYSDSGTWKLVGHMVARSSIASNQHVGNFAAATKYYVNWIKSVIVDYDTDMDGLPDWWETLYGSGPTSMERDGHLDSDGFTNYEEWLADTIPTDGNSFLEVLDYTEATRLVFSSSIHRKYQVQYRVDITDANEVWEAELDWFDGLGSQTVLSVSAATTNRFYRVRAKLR